MKVGALPLSNEPVARRSSLDDNIALGALLKRVSTEELQNIMSGEAK
jgi:hypothetical protein